MSDEADATMKLELDDDTADCVEFYADALGVKRDEYALFAVMFMNELCKVVSDEKDSGSAEAFECVKKAAHELFLGQTEALPKVKAEHKTVRRVCEMIVCIGRDVMYSEDDEDA